MIHHKGWKFLDRIEAEVAEFVNTELKKNQLISNDLIKAYAVSLVSKYRRFQHFNFSDIWLPGFLARHQDVLTQEELQRR